MPSGMSKPIVYLDNWGKKDSEEDIRFSAYLGRERIEKLI